MGKIEQKLPITTEKQRLSAHHTLYSRFKHAIGLDRAIAFTVLARGWSTVAGVVTVLLIARFLTPAEQGYYYTFSSLVALQIVFELGFSFVILQMASHERAHISISPEYEITGDTVAHARLSSILQKTVHWYSAAAVLMAVTLVPVGLYFFSTHQSSAQHVFWRTPWCFAAVAATLNFQMDPLLSFFEGCGYVSDVARVRSVQAITSSLFAWTALAAHRGLFAPSMMMCGTALVSGVWLFGRRRFLLGLMFYRPGSNGIRWGIEVWPFQWRIAISWLCGYFIFQLFNPVLFAYRGAVEAGQMGMSLSVASALSAVAISWMSTKAAPFGTLIERREYLTLDSLFLRTLWQSAILLVVGSFVLMLGLYIVFQGFPHFAVRLLPLPIFAVLLATIVCNHITSSEALYLRAHKREPFLVQSIVVGILTGGGTLLTGKIYGASGVTISYFVTSGIFGLASGTYLFVTRRQQWHNPMPIKEKSIS
jgi:hypothetical protein